MKRRQNYSRGSKGLLYINQGVSDNLLGFINKQTELNGVLLLGIKLVAEKYGDIDVINHVPRTFDIQSTVQTESKLPDVAPSAPPIIAEPAPIINTGSGDSLVNSKPEGDSMQNAPFAEQLSDLMQKMNELMAENEKLRTKNETQNNSGRSSDNETSVQTKSKSKNLFEQDTGDVFDIKLD